MFYITHSTNSTRLTHISTRLTHIMPKAFLVKRTVNKTDITQPDISGCNEGTKDINSPLLSLSLHGTGNKEVPSIKIYKENDQPLNIPKDHKTAQTYPELFDYLHQQIEEHRASTLCCLPLPPLGGLYLPRAYHLSQRNLFPSHSPNTQSQVFQPSTSPSITRSVSPDVIIPSPVGIRKLSLYTEDAPLALSPSNKERSTRIFFPPSEITKIDEDYKKHQCQVCMKWFKRASSLSNHRLIHKNSKSFECEHCDMRFLRKSDLGKHIVIHSGSKPYQCETCGKRFSQSSNMLTHQRRHSGVRPYSCTYCGKSFYRKVDVRRHSSVHREF